MAGMHSINIRELRNTKRLKTWLRQGETVELRERDEVIGKIVPIDSSRGTEWPDFGQRLKKAFGKKRVPGSDLLMEERGRF